MAQDFLDETRAQIRARLKELKPLVQEYRRLEEAAAALEGVGLTSGTLPAAARRRAPRAPATASTARRGRPKGSGTRGAEALSLVRETPGITIPQIAERMGIKQNYLYRVLAGLAADGVVTKDGPGWFPNEATPDPAV